jgi:DNA-binding transcriptional regulator YiaG
MVPHNAAENNIGFLQYARVHMEDRMYEQHHPRAPHAIRKTPLGQWLTELRLQHGLRTQDVAFHLGVNQGRVSEWETGTKEPGPEELKRLLQHYQRLPSEL